MKVPCLHPNSSLRVLLIETAGTLTVDICNILEAKNLSKLALCSGDIHLLSGEITEAAHSRLEASHFQAEVGIYGHDGDLEDSTSALHWLERAGFARRDHFIANSNYSVRGPYMTVMELRRSNQPVLLFSLCVSTCSTARQPEVERPTLLAHEQQEAALYLETETGFNLRSLQHGNWLLAGSCGNDTVLQ